MHLVLTACTNRKRLPALPELRAASLGHGPVAAVAEAWLERLRRADKCVPAAQLYAGRGFFEASRTAADLGAPLAIISAGLGVVDAASSVPPYALSVAVGSQDSVLARLTDRADAPLWWQAFSGRSPFGQPLAGVVAASTGLVLVALSDAYLAMVAADLAALPPSDAARVRIMTRAPLERIDPALHDRVMPYDDRLDGPDSTVRGTRGDFAARAASHFAQAIVSKLPAGSAEEHAAVVQQVLQSWRPAPTFDRARHDDETLLGLIRDNWERAGGRSTRLLRVLRDDLNIACEQGRFVGLMNRLRDEKAAAA